MGLRDSPKFQENLEKLQYLINQREEARTELNQRYLTIDSIVDRLDVLDQLGLLEGKRVLTIGDADLTGLAIAIFGEPSEVVVADIDDRLSELYFEATMEYDLPVRFVYHDMRIKMIAILKNQYTLVLTEPPRTVGAIQLFLSRGLQILEPGASNRLMISIPSTGILKETLDREIEEYGISIESVHHNINQYEDGSTPTDFIELNVPVDVEPRMTNHYVEPLYEQEVNQEIKEYRCVCRSTISVGPGATFVSIEDLEAKGCPDCDYEGVFAYKSSIQLK